MDRGRSKTSRVALPREFTWNTITRKELKAFWGAMQTDQYDFESFKAEAKLQANPFPNKCAEPLKQETKKRLFTK